MNFKFNFKTTSYHLHPLQVENCDSNSRLVVDEDDTGKFRPERVNIQRTKVSYIPTAGIIMQYLLWGGWVSPPRGPPWATS